MIDPNVSVMDQDTSNPNITSATVALTTNYNASQDMLGFLSVRVQHHLNQNGISGSFNPNTGVLTLTTHR